MTKRIQAYFKSEDDAQGAKTALIPYSVDMEVWPLTDPLARDHRILVPLIPLGNSAMSAGGFSTSGTSTAPGAGAALVTSTGIPQSIDETENLSNDKQPYEDDIIGDGDLKELRYVAELKVEDQKYNEIVHILRGKGAYVELFE